MCIWKVPDLTAPANFLFFRLSKVFLFYLRVFIKIVTFWLFLNVYFPPFYKAVLWMPDPLVFNAAAMPWGSLDNWRAFKIYCVVDSSAWNSCGTLVMVWCKQGIIVRRTDWTCCWNRPDWTENVITVKTGGKSWLQRRQCQKWMESPPLAFTPLFTRSSLRSLANKVKKLRKVRINICQFGVSPQF